jgi:hypothetical protein
LASQILAIVALVPRGIDHKRAHPVTTAAGERHCSEKKNSGSRDRMNGSRHMTISGDNAAAKCHETLVCPFA